MTKVAGFALLVAGCGGPALPDEHRAPLAFDEQSALGFSVAELAPMDRAIASTLKWQAARAGFSALPDAGETPVEATLRYEGGEIVEVGAPAEQVEADLVLRVKTSDGSLDETVPCLLRAPAVDFWICQGDLGSFSGSFAVMEHPEGNLAYTAWMRANGTQISGGVGAVVETTTQQSPSQSTGTTTGFQAGLWSE